MESRKGEAHRELGEEGPLALSQTVATRPATNLEQEPERAIGIEEDETLPMLAPSMQPLTLLSPLLFPLPLSLILLPCRFVAPIINISQLLRVTGRSSLHRFGLFVFHLGCASSSSYQSSYGSSCSGLGRVLSILCPLPASSRARVTPAWFIR